MTALTELRNAGVNLSLNDENNIILSPISKLTEQQRELIRLNKPTIVNELKLEKPYVRWHIETPSEDTCFYVIPPITLEEIKAKFPKAILIVPVETLQ